MIATRLGTVATAAALLLGMNAAVARAESTIGPSGEFSWAATDVKRLANCAATAWYNDSKVGDEITNCTNAGADSHWDGFHLVAATVHTINGRQVAPRSDQSCPAKRGFQYVKCFYVHGQSPGNPVVTVSIISSGFGGQDVAVDWYYL